LACDDSHLLVVQAGNLGVGPPPRAKKSLPPLLGRLGVPATYLPRTWDVAATSHDNLMERQAYDAKVRGNAEELASPHE